MGRQWWSDRKLSLARGLGPAGRRRGRRRTLRRRGRRRVGRRGGHGHADGPCPDTITDFLPVEADQLDLLAFPAPSDFTTLPLTADGTATMVDLSAYGGGTIRLEGVAVSDLAAEDFLLPPP